MTTLKLYRVDEGAIYWMSLAEGTAIEARALVMAESGESEGDLSPLEAWELSELTEEKSSRPLKYENDDGTTSETTLWKEHLAATKPTIHGCSEWD